MHQRLECQSNAQQDAIGDEAFLSHSLAVHIEQSVEPTFLVGGGSDDTLNVEAIDPHRDRSLLVGAGGFGQSLGLHLLQTGQEGFGLADSERGHDLRSGDGRAVELVYCSTSSAVMRGHPAIKLKAQKKRGGKPPYPNVPGIYHGTPVNGL